MRILAVGRSWVVPEYRKLLRCLNEHPLAPSLSVVTPDYAVEGGQRVATVLDQKEQFEVIVKRPLFRRQHLHFYPMIGKIISRVKPDIVFLLEEPNSIVTATTLSICRRVSPKSCATFYTFLNDDRDFSQMGGLRSVVFPFTMRTVFALAAGAICSSTAAERQMVTRGFKGSTAVIPFGTDAENPVSSEDSVRALRMALGGEASFIVGAVGRLEKAKGFDILITALSKTTCGGWKLVLVGDGPERAALESLAKACNVPALFVGQVMHGQVRKHMAAFDLLVVPSRRAGNWVEQFGRVIVEAMSVGVPVLGSTSGEIPNVIDNAGWVFGEDDAFDLVNQLERIMRMPRESRAAMGLRGLQRCRDTFDYRGLAVKYLDFFTSLLQARQ